MTADPIEIPIEATFVFLAETVLKLSLYPWQVDSIMPFDTASQKLVQVSLVTPNESGKSSYVIPTLVIGWLMRYARGKVVLTSADGRQLDSQVMPAIEKHRAKFPSWKFIEREIQTPTGGNFVAFTTDQPGRAEGWHREDDIDGPLLIIVDEAKTVPDEIFLAIDRCGYNALLLTSSPGKMHGRFYDSQTTTPGFRRIKAGLKDCPHITPDKIQRLKDQHGPDSAFPNPSFLASTLEGEFMESDGELRFNRDGLDRLKVMAETFDRTWRSRARTDPNLSHIGTLAIQPRGYESAITWHPDQETGWVWLAEQEPTPGRAYIGFCDPMTGEQSDGSKERDTHAAGILGLAYLDQTGDIPRHYNDEVIACLHHEGGCRWDNDILAERFATLLHYFRCPAIVEANNSGTEVMRLLQLLGCQLWRRQKRDHRVPGKMLDVVGFQTTAGSKNQWIGAIGRAIREQDFDCRYPPAVQQLATFVLNEKGTGEAQAGAKDDFVTGFGLGMFAKGSAVKYRLAATTRIAIGQATGPRGAWM